MSVVADPHPATMVRPDHRGLEFAPGRKLLGLRLARQCGTLLLLQPTLEASVVAHCRHRRRPLLPAPQGGGPPGSGAVLGQRRSIPSWMSPSAPSVVLLLLLRLVVLAAVLGAVPAQATAGTGHHRHRVVGAARFIRRRSGVALHTNVRLLLQLPLLLPPPLQPPPLPD